MGCLVLAEAVCDGWEQLESVTPLDPLIMSVYAVAWRGHDATIGDPVPEASLRVVLGKQDAGILFRAPGRERVVRFQTLPLGAIRLVGDNGVLIMDLDRTRQQMLAAAARGLGSSGAAEGSSHHAAMSPTAAVQATRASGSKQQGRGGRVQRRRPVIQGPNDS